MRPDNVCVIYWGKTGKQEESVKKRAVISADPSCDVTEKVKKHERQAASNWNKGRIRGEPLDAASRCIFSNKLLKLLGIKLQ